MVTPPSPVCNEAVKTSSGATLDLTRLLVLVAALALGAYFWTSPVLWPLKLLVVTLHETGHAVATWIAGGSVGRLTVSWDESGACLSRLPNGFFAQVLVYSSGYVGSALAGGLMLLLTFRFRLRRPVLWAACLWLAVVGVVLAGDLFTRAFCLGTAVVIALCARFLPAAAVDLLNLFVAAFSALYVVFDLRSDLWDHHVRSSSDAALLADLTHVPAIVWAVLWSGFSLLVLGAAAWSSLQRRHRPQPLALDRP